MLWKLPLRLFPTQVAAGVFNINRLHRKQFYILYHRISELEYQLCSPTNVESNKPSRFRNYNLACFVQFITAHATMQSKSRGINHVLWTALRLSDLLRFAIFMYVDVFAMANPFAMILVDAFSMVRL